MASLDRRLNPLYAIKECSSCGNLHTKDCGCSKGSLEDRSLFIPDSQRPLKIEKNCLDCGDPVHGLYCRQCALIRKTLEEVFQDFQDTSKSSNDDTNFVNQEPFIVKQGPGVNSSQIPPQINHNCCYECGDSLDDIFCQRCTCKSCGKGAHYGYNCPKLGESLEEYGDLIKVLIVAWFRIRDNRNLRWTIVTIMSTFPTRLISTSLTKDVV
ncbi:hypothetical protein Tco_1236986 [Tanacetum coccineum]